jgi:alanine racemase
LEIEGIFSHFANAETPDLTSAREQLARFRAVLEIYDRLGVPRPPLQHTANSGAILQLPESHMGMVRAGVMLYGIYPDRHIRRIVDVQPALTWHSRVAHSKITQPGRPVSYGSTWRPEHPTRILTLPCGYADGYFRRMSNIAKVIVRGDLHQQVGRICMDHFMVDVGNLDVGIGEDAILLGRSPSGCSITAEDLADWAGTNEYEVMTSISARVPRMYKSSARRE